MTEASLITRGLAARELPIGLLGHVLLLPETNGMLSLVRHCAVQTSPQAFCRVFTSCGQCVVSVLKSDSQLQSEASNSTCEHGSGPPPGLRSGGSWPPSLPAAESASHMFYTINPPCRAPPWTPSCGSCFAASPAAKAKTHAACHDDISEHLHVSDGALGGLERTIAPYDPLRHLCLHSVHVQYLVLHRLTSATVTLSDGQWDVTSFAWGERPQSGRRCQLCASSARLPRMLSGAAKPPILNVI